MHNCDARQQIVFFDSPRVRTIGNVLYEWRDNAPDEWFLKRVEEAVREYLPATWEAASTTEKRITVMRWKKINKHYQSEGTFDCLVRVRAEADNPINGEYRIVMNFQEDGENSIWWGFTERLPGNADAMNLDDYLTLNLKPSPGGQLITGFRFGCDFSTFVSIEN